MYIYIYIYIYVRLPMSEKPLCISRRDTAAICDAS